MVPYSGPKAWLLLILIVSVLHIIFLFNSNTSATFTSNSSPLKQEWSNTTKSLVSKSLDYSSCKFLLIELNLQLWVSACDAYLLWEKSTPQSFQKQQPSYWRLAAARALWFLLNDSSLCLPLEREAQRRLNECSQAASCTHTMDGFHKVLLLKSIPSQ